MALQFEIYDRAGASQGDISTICLSKSVTKRLNRPATARGIVPSHLASFLSAGDKQLRVRLDGTIIFNGIVWFVEDDGDEDTVYSEFVAVDPMIWWKYRPARDADGDFSKPTFLRDFKNGPAIIKEIVKNAVVALNADGSPDGPMGIDYSGGTFSGSPIDLSGAPIDWPATLGDVTAMLTDTGAVDVILTPNESSTNMVTLNVYGQAGTNRSSSVIFEYQAGAYNARRMHRSEDMDSISNAVRYYLTPKQTPQVYRSNITKDDFGPAPPKGSPPGTPYTNSAPHPLSPFASGTLIDQIEASRVKYGKFVTWRTYLTDIDFPLLEQKLLLWKLWKTESLLRLKPRELVTTTPNRGVNPAFDVGDIIGVRAGTKMRGGFSGSQRVYEYTLREDRDGPIEINDIVTSFDGG